MMIGGQFVVPHENPMTLWPLEAGHAIRTAWNPVPVAHGLSYPLDDCVGITRGQVDDPRWVREKGFRVRIRGTPAK